MSRTIWVCECDTYWLTNESDARTHAKEKGHKLTEKHISEKDYLTLKARETSIPLHESVICPLQANSACWEDGCAWWDEKYQMCCVKALARRLQEQ